MTWQRDVETGLTTSFRAFVEAAAKREEPISVVSRLPTAFPVVRDGLVERIAELESEGVHWLEASTLSTEHEVSGG